MHPQSPSAFNQLNTGLTDVSLPHIRSLKLRQMPITDNALAELLSHFPNLRRIDISFTPVSHLSQCQKHMSNELQKLSVTSTRIRSPDIISILVHAPRVRTLSIGALGGVASALTFTDQTLATVTDVLASNVHLESVNLIGNTKLGTTSTGALREFITRVGRKCKVKLSYISPQCVDSGFKWLNLSSISISSRDLDGLLESEDDTPPALTTLILNNTGIGDDAARYIASCVRLTTLELVSTRISSKHPQATPAFLTGLSEAGIFTILGSCEHIRHLDITSCRGISVAERRRIFEVGGHCSMTERLLIGLD